MTSAQETSERELLALADELVAIAEERRSVAMRCYADGGHEDDTPLEEYTEYQAAIALRLAASREGGAPAWRDEIALRIDHSAWVEPVTYSKQVRQRSALRKADAIVALLVSRPQRGAESNDLDLEDR